MARVKLQKETSPVFIWVVFFLISTVTMGVLFVGIPGSGFNGLRSGVYFDMEAGFDDARFMDSRIKCESSEALKGIRAALVELRSDYPVERVTLKLENYPSGYKFQVRYVTYYAQKLNFGGDKIFRRGSQVGDPEIDAQVKQKDAEIEKAIRDTLESYFVSRGAK